MPTAATTTTLSRDRLTRLASWAKRAGFVDLALRYNPLIRARAFHVIAKFEKARDIAERRRLSHQLYMKTIAQARTTGYGKTFDASGEQWPVLKKVLLRNNAADFHIPGFLRIPAATGGTTGLPIRLLRSPVSIVAEQAFLDHMLAAYNLKLNHARVAVLRGDAIKPVTDQQPPYGIKTHWGRRLILSSPHLSQDTIEWYVDAIREFKPDALVMYPTMAATLVRLIQAKSLSLRVPLVVTSSEVLATNVYLQLEKVLGARVFDYYGQSERVALAYGDGPERYWFHPAYGRVELIPSPEDEIEGDRRNVRIIATGFWNDAMPLVRYDTGDFAVVPKDATAAELEGIALGLKPFFGIAGRIDEFICLPGGGTVGGLTQMCWEVPNLLQVQLVQESLTSVTVRVQAMPGFGQAEIDKMTAKARAKIPLSVNLNFELVDRLERTASGKSPFIIRRLPISI
jgi:phenylacetate-CoA ligase